MAKKKSWNFVYILAQCESQSNLTIYWRKIFNLFSWFAIILKISKMSKTAKKIVKVCLHKFSADLTSIWRLFWRKILKIYFSDFEMSKVAKKNVKVCLHSPTSIWRLFWRENIKIIFLCLWNIKSIGKNLESLLFTSSHIHLTTFLTWKYQNSIFVTLKCQKLWINSWKLFLRLLISIWRFFDVETWKLYFRYFEMSKVAKKKIVGNVFGDFFDAEI